MASTRPRGFSAWSPQTKSRELIQAIEQVLDTYRDSLPLTARQIYYRLVATIDYEKTEQGYDRLGELLNRARRAGLIDMNAIRDDGAVVVGNDRFDDADDFIRSCRSWADGFELDLMQDQPIHLELLCEAAGMVPQLNRVARPYGVTVRSSGGFDSTTVKHNLGRFYGRIGKPAVVLHVGDHDPSGEHIHLNLAEDVGAFAAHYGGTVAVHRISVTPEQQALYALPTAAPKKSDKRSFSSDFTVQAEALPPDVLAEIVRTEIERHLDLETLSESRERQAEIRQELLNKLDGLS
jgi:hypothetical protein